MVKKNETTRSIDVETTTGVNDTVILISSLDFRLTGEQTFIRKADVGKGKFTPAIFSYQAVSSVSLCRYAASSCIELASVYYLF